MDIYMDLYKKKEISMDNFLSDKVREDDPVVEYMVKRLTGVKKIDYSKVDEKVIDTYIRVMEVIRDNPFSEPESVIKKSDDDIKKYVKFVVGLYHSKYMDEGLEEAKSRSGHIPNRHEYI